MEALIDRLMGKVELPADPDGCWEWQAAVAGAGYGVIGRTDEGSRYVHRIVYEFSVGPIPDGLEIDHLCRNRRCVNPDHLEPVTHTENRRRARWSRCARGHEIFERKNGRRTCLRCDADRAAAKRARLRSSR